jgi:anti-sigma regulatory factor (Ser/Thr protein kinase)
METVLAAQARQSSHLLHDASQVSAVRRAASDLCAALAYDVRSAGEVALLVTEAATNILKHAERGEILLRTSRGSGIEIVALDQGPGMGNFSASASDGASTTGSYGVGLGAMQRLASLFDVYSAPGKGTAILMVYWPRGMQPPVPSIHCGVACLPLPGESVCGDSWSLAWDATTATALLADGLGHGPNAAEASELAAEVAMRKPQLPAGAMLQDVHGALRPTRGAAVAIASFDMLHERLLFAGIGNISAHLMHGGQHRQLVSHNGIVGSNMRKVQEFTAGWNSEATLVLHSDGLGSRWDLDDYPGLLHCHPSLLAGVLYRDFRRGSDDVSVLVLRDRQGWQP